MPVQNCEIEGKPGYKWGEEGTCYPYTPGDEDSQKAAMMKAGQQGKAAMMSMEARKLKLTPRQIEAVITTLQKKLQEAGARHSREDNAALQEIHDMAVKLGASCPAMMEESKHG